MTKAESVQERPGQRKRYFIGRRGGEREQGDESVQEWPDQRKRQHWEEGRGSGSKKLRKRVKPCFPRQG